MRTNPEHFTPLTFGDIEWAAEVQQLAILQAEHSAFLTSIGIIDTARAVLIAQEEKRLADRAVGNGGQQPGDGLPQSYYDGITSAAVWRQSVQLGHHKLNKLTVDRYALWLATTHIKDTGEEGKLHQNIDVASTYGGIVYPYPGFTGGESQVVVDKGYELMEACRSGVVPHLSYDLMHITVPQVVRNLNGVSPIK